LISRTDTINLTPMKEPLLLALIGLFIAVLIIRLAKAYLLAHRLKGKEPDIPEDADEQLLSLMEKVETPQKARETIRNISRLASRVKTPTGRSAYFVAAGHLAINPLRRPKLAVGFYLRALRSNPTSLDALHKLQEILLAQKRFRRMEWTYWEVLARLDDSEVGEEMWMVCWAGLAAIYAATPRGVHKADAIRKALKAFVTDEEEEKALERISNMPKVAP
jgi:hypothetical protein